jgi:UDP:flavonoid glycosyltransferase YjiC (YdhE family)
MMSKILFTNLWSDDLGLPTRTVPIAVELKKKGHEICFCNPAAAPSAIIQEAGLLNISPEIHLAPAMNVPWTTEVWNVDHFSALFGYGDEAYVEDCVGAVIRVIEAFGADMVVDSWNLFSCMAARILKKPLATVIQADMHPANKGFMWWRRLPDDIPTPVPVLNKILARHGLAPLTNSAELFQGDLTLCTGIPETDPIPKSEDVVYVGPIFYGPVDAGLPDWFDEIAEDKPLIWVYSGNPEYFRGIRTWGDSIVVLEASIAALAGRDVTVVMTTGHHELPEELRPLPENIRFEKFLPGISLARRCGLMIHHGGHGSTMTAAYAGTPSVIIPTYSERESNARRMAALGAAEMILPDTDAAFKRKVSPETLWKTTAQVLTDPAYRQNAKKISEKMRGFGGHRQAARLIDEFTGALAAH